MKAEETNFQHLIEGTKQYVVPLFQRSYSWQKKQWQELLNDLNDLYESDTTYNHFIGSIVTSPLSASPASITQYLLIDGQQRLTTVFILLILLRDIFNESKEKLAHKIQNTLLTNQYHDDSDYYKLLPTQQDRAAFCELIENNLSNEASQLKECYFFFKRHITKLDGEKLQRILINRLSVVSITLHADDNPYIVFESLNAKGLSLTQADLIRNYFFMQIDAKQQDSLYQKYWLPMQNALQEQLTEFMRHYLASDGKIIKKDSVYHALKEKVDYQHNALDELKRLKNFAHYYDIIINPAKEHHVELKRALFKIQRLDFTVVYPFLLRCYDDYAQKLLAVEHFIDIILIIENFIIRRFVCNIATHGLNKIFPVLYQQAKKHAENLIDGVCYILQLQSYPKDADFKKALIESRLYGNGDRGIKTRIILEALENSFNHKECPDVKKANIEHIMPQTLTPEWQQQLAETGQQDYDLYLHTLGNLTLTAYNPELSNKSFKDKKVLLSNSNFSLNKYFADVEQWNRESIEKRANYLAKRALEIWAYFGEVNKIKNEQSVTGKKPTQFIILGEHFNVKTWSSVIVQLLNWIIVNESELFTELVNDYPRLISMNAVNFRKSQRLKNDYYVETNLSAERIYRFCLQIMQPLNLSKQDWEIKFD